jgi:hypothetical protein
VNRWREPDKLRPDEAELVDALLAPTLELAGYESAGARTAPLRARVAHVGKLMLALTRIAQLRGNTGSAPSLELWGYLQQSARRPAASRGALRSRDRRPLAASAPRRQSMQGSSSGLPASFSAIGSSCVSAPRALPVSIVIPAHDEARVIGRCLTRLQRGAEAGELELIVVCNGCSDATAAAARLAAPGATVVELDDASKAAALNVGDELATRFPRLYIDADVEMDVAAVRAVAAALTAEGIHCAAPLPHFDVQPCPWYVRFFCRVLSGMPFLSGAHAVGTGVYGLSEQGRRRFGKFPMLTADDLFVMERFATYERRSVRTESFTVHPPRNLDGLLAVRTRVYRGNSELRRQVDPVEHVAHHNAGTLLRLLVNPRTTLAVPVYVGVNLVARWRAAQSWNGRWERDLSSR